MATLVSALIDDIVDLGGITTTQQGYTRENILRQANRILQDNIVYELLKGNADYLTATVEYTRSQNGEYTIPSDAISNSLLKVQYKGSGTDQYWRDLEQVDFGNSYDFGWHFNKNKIKIVDSYLTTNNVINLRIVYPKKPQIMVEEAPTPIDNEIISITPTNTDHVFAILKDITLQNRAGTLASPSGFRAIQFRQVPTPGTYYLQSNEFPFEVTETIIPEDIFTGIDVNHPDGDSEFAIYEVPYVELVLTPPEVGDPRILTVNERGRFIATSPTRYYTLEQFNQYFRNITPGELSHLTVAPTTIHYFPLPETIMKLLVYETVLYFSIQLGNSDQIRRFTKMRDDHLEIVKGFYLNRAKRSPKVSSSRLMRNVGMSFSNNQGWIR